MVSYQWSFLKATFRCFSNHAVPKLLMATFILYKGSLFGLASLSILLWTKSAVLLTGMPILGGKMHKDRCTKTYACFPTTYFSDTPHVNITESKRQVAIIPKMENTPYCLPTCSLHCHSRLIMLSDYVSHIEKMKNIQLNKGMETEFENGEISEKMTGDTDARRKKKSESLGASDSLFTSRDCMRGMNVVLCAGQTVGSNVCVCEKERET